jgi:hypothetical protein
MHPSVKRPSKQPMKLINLSKGLPLIVKCTSLIKLRQGDPLSPMLFNIVTNILAILTARAKEDGKVNSLIPPPS